MKVHKSPHISRRGQLGKLLNDHGGSDHVTGLAAEIGTHQGQFAASLLARWSHGTLLCIDPWQQEIPGYDDSIGRGDRLADFQRAKEQLRPFEGRYCMLRGMSSDVAPLVCDESLDLVYIDANHRRKYVEEDLRLWIPKVCRGHGGQRGGIVAGHDWNGDWKDEVQPVVTSVAEKMGVSELFYVLGDAASWYFFKP